MFKFWQKKSTPEESQSSPEASSETSNSSGNSTPQTVPATDGSLTWDEQARAGLQQALAQAPVPAMLKGKVKNELKKAAEAHTRAAGRTTVTAEDLMNGLLSKLPANMRGQVEEAMKGGPEKLEELQKKLQK